MKLLVAFLILFCAPNSNAEFISTYACAQLLGHAKIIVEGEIVAVDSLYFRLKVKQVFKGELTVPEILVGKYLSKDTYFTRKDRWDVWKHGQREIVFLNLKYDRLDILNDSIFDLASHYGDSEIPIINDTAFLQAPFGEGSNNWNSKYLNFFKGKFYHLSNLEKRYPLLADEFFEALKFCLENDEKIIKKCRKDRLRNQVKEKRIFQNENYKFKYWDGWIHDKWIKKQQARSKSFERLLDEYYEGFSNLNGLEWNKKTHRANTGLKKKLKR